VESAEIQISRIGVFGEITNFASSGSSNSTSSLPLSPSHVKAVRVAGVQHAALQIVERRFATFF